MQREKTVRAAIFEHIYAVTVVVAVAIAVNCTTPSAQLDSGNNRTLSHLSNDVGPSSELPFFSTRAWTLNGDKRDPLHIMLQFLRLPGHGKRLDPHPCNRRPSYSSALLERLCGLDHLQRLLLVRRIA